MKPDKLATFFLNKTLQHCLADDSLYLVRLVRKDTGKEVPVIMMETRVKGLAADKAALIPFAEMIPPDGGLNYVLPDGAEAKVAEMSPEGCKLAADQDPAAAAWTRQHPEQPS